MNGKAYGHGGDASVATGVPCSMPVRIKKPPVSDRENAAITGIALEMTASDYERLHTAFASDEDHPDV